MSLTHEEGAKLLGLVDDASSGLREYIAKLQQPGTQPPDQDDLLFETPWLGYFTSADNPLNRLYPHDAPTWYAPLESARRAPESKWLRHDWVDEIWPCRADIVKDVLGEIKLRVWRQPAACGYGRKLVSIRAKGPSIVWACGSSSGCINDCYQLIGAFRPLCPEQGAACVFVELLTRPTPR